MDAIKLLKQDHSNVKALFQQYEEMGDRAFAGKKKLADRICLELTKHAVIEEEIFYPALREASKEIEDQLDEASVEHASLKALIWQIGQMDPHDELYDAKVKVLGEYVNHHVKEEEGELFPQARQSGMDLATLGREMEARKEEVDSVPGEMPIPAGAKAAGSARAAR